MDSESFAALSQGGHFDGGVSIRRQAELPDGIYHQSFKAQTLASGFAQEREPLDHFQSATGFWKIYCCNPEAPLLLRTWALPTAIVDGFHGPADPPRCNRGERFAQPSPF